MGLLDVNRKGKFRLYGVRELIQTQPEFITAIFKQGIIIVDMEQHIFADEIIYTGVWEKFDVIQVGQSIPFYVLVWNDESSEVTCSILKEV